jgi:UDP-glucose 4-epimerase
MAVLITGVAGFIGSNLALELLNRGEKVLGIDNLCRGSLENLSQCGAHQNFSFIEVDMFNLKAYSGAIKGYKFIQDLNTVWHMAANSDIPAGINDANVDLRDTFMTTFNTLEVMRDVGIKAIAFASSSAIYGNLGEAPLFEDVGPLLPISNYGAMKLASEAAISAAAESFLDQALIFRFPNVIGVPATHGVMLDFIRKLKKSPDILKVLGDGTQQKGYLHVEELIDAMLFIANHAKKKIELFNIGADDEGVTVKFIAQETVRLMSPNARIEYGEGNRGWVGDVPKFTYSIDKLKKYGWSSKMGSHESVKKALGQIAEQELNKE